MFAREVGIFRATICWNNETPVGKLSTLVRYVVLLRTDSLAESALLILPYIYARKGNKMKVITR